MRKPMKTFIMVCTLLAAQPGLIARHNTVASSGISIGVELSQSPLTLAMMHYNKDQWQVASGRDMRQIYTPVLYGLNAGFRIKGIQVGLRLAVGPMRGDDQGSFKSVVNSSDLSNGYTTYLRQTQFLSALAVGKKLQSGKFSFTLNAELPYLHYTEGEYVETVSHITYYSNSTAVNYTFQGNSHYSMPSGSVYGLGAGAECGYRIGRRIELALGFNAWMLRYTYSKPISLTYNTANASYRMDGGLNTRANGSSYYTLQSDAAFWLMSGIMPSFRLHYHLL
jgi:hypothetical protein